MALRGKVALVRHLFADLPSREAPPGARKRFDDAFVGHPGLGLRLFDDRGRLLLGIGPGAAAQQPPGAVLPPVAEANDIETDPLMRTTAWGPLGDGRQVRFVLSLERGAKEALLSAHLGHTLLAVVIGSVVAALLGYALTRYSLRPVRAIAAQASGIRASGLDRRLDVDSTPAELKEIALSFNGMLARLEDAFKRLSDFSSDLAHDLRTPINNLMGLTQVALSRPRDEAELRDILGSNLEEFERLAHMIDDMLFLARADNAQATLRRELVDLGAEAQRIASYFEALAEERGITIETRGSATVEAGRGMVQRAIANLVSNAMRHAPRGSRVGIDVGAAPRGTPTVTVTDAGPGIAGEKLARIFDRFYQADAAREDSQPGSGLGLAIVKSIMNLHGGDVAVASEPGKGAAFSLTFPAGA